MCGNVDILLIKMGNPLFTRDSTLGSFHMFDLGDLFVTHPDTSDLCLIPEWNQRPFAWLVNL